MPYAVELAFDDAADSRIRELWGALVEAGLPATGFLTDGYRPHVSVGAFEAADVESILPALGRAVAPAAGLRLSLPAVGFFLDGGPSRAFLGVTVSERLVRVHRNVAEVVADAGATPRAYYLDGAWTPHCTLPVEAADPAEIVAVVHRFGLPVVAETAAVDLIELPSGASVGRLA